MMKLIADSGSTKTDWALVGTDGLVRVMKTQGINPIHQTEDTIRTIVRDELKVQLAGESIAQVFFYGSGVRPDKEQQMAVVLSEELGAPAVEAKGDLLGAARALCGHEEGIACILGTGANSSLFDGISIVQNTPPMGYILGDEGSGAVLGRELLNALYKGLLPRDLLQAFEHAYALSLSDVIERVYRRPMANRFLASLSPFIHQHLHVEAVQQMVEESMRRFIRRNVAPYQRRDLPLAAVGSIAYYYSEQLRQAAQKEGYAVGKIERSPLEALVEYHR